MAQLLSQGSLQIIMNGGEVLNPVLQILGSKKITGNPANPTNERYRLLVSDGIHLNSFAMLATQLNDKLLSGDLDDYTIVKIKRHIVSMVSNQGRGEKRVMIILDLDVLQHGSEVGLKIGNPVPYTDANAQAAQNPAPTPSSSPAPSPVSSAKSGPAKPLTNFGNYRPTVPQNTSFGSSNSSQMKRTHPIATLSPYQNRWTIKVRVTAKTPIRTWSNARGEGKLFSMDLVDESGEIRATAFKDQCDKFYDLIEINKVYFISKAQLKSANKKFCTLNNDYEITLNNDTEIWPCDEDDNAIPQLQFNFAKLNLLTNIKSDTLVDVIGVCRSAKEIQNLVSKTTNRELKKRDVEIVDQSFTAVNITLWSTQAVEFDGSSQPIVAIKNGRVQEYNEMKTISLMPASVLQINPDIDEAHKLRGWFDCLPHDTSFKNISTLSDNDDYSSPSNQWITWRQVRKKQLGRKDKPDYFSNLITILFIKPDCLYKSCPQPDCMKKVIDQNTGMFRCEKCNREFDTFKWRLLMRMRVADWTGTKWVTVFNDVAEQILGYTAEEIAEKKDNNMLYQCLSEAQLKECLMRFRVKMDNYNDEARMQVSGIQSKRLDYKEKCERLIASIEKLTGISAADV